MIIGKGKDTVKSPCGEYDSQDVGDDSHDVLGTILLVKFKSESGRDRVEVAMGPGFVATLDAIGSGNGDKDVQESVIEIENRSHGIIDSE